MMKEGFPRAAKPRTPLVKRISEVQRRVQAPIFLARKTPFPLFACVCLCQSVKGKHSMPAHLIGPCRAHPTAQFGRSRGKVEGEEPFGMRRRDFIAALTASVFLAP